LFFERFDVRILSEKKTRDARDDARFVAANDGDGRKNFHELIASVRQTTGSSNDCAGAEFIFSS
jgi:hypothetical protein